MQNVSESPIYLKKGVQVTHLVPALPVLPSAPALVSGGATALEAIVESLPMVEWQAKLLEKLDLSGLKNWAPRNAEAAQQLVLSYHNVFALDKNKLGCTSAVEHEIRIVDSEPFKERFRRIPPLFLEEARASLRDMLDAGTIRPSQSPWCNAIMLVRKKDGTLPFCVDFRWLNAQTKKDSYPLPRIQEALESMASAAHFSSMDLKSRFWQVKMAPGSQPYMTFTIGNLGFYEFTQMPFGLGNMLATFQRLMQNTLGELNLTYCIIYLDDVIVFRHMEEEHLECLRVVFEHFREFNLKLKPSKCNLFKSEIIYLAHHVSKEGMHPSKDNVCTIEEFPMPETFTQVRVFCRLAGYYRQFIKGFVNIAHPLYDVLGKETKMGPVQLPPEAREVVWTLKEKILTSPLLAFPDFTKPFLLETDASKEGLGAVLSQKQDDGRFHPVAFGSCSLTPTERNYHSSKLEFLALKWGVMEHFREYLAYTPFMMKMDNNRLTYVLTTLNLDATGHRWVGALASFEFELEYQKGSENGAADALSRVPIQHDWRTVKSLMEGAVMGTSSRCEAQASDALRKEHKWLREDACLQAAKLAPMHMVDWAELQDSDPMLATCTKWLRMCKETLSPKRDTLLCELLGRHMEGEGRCSLKYEIV